MKKLVFKLKDNFGLLLLLTSLFYVIIAVTGCIYTETDVVGKYSRIGTTVNETLILRNNYTFEQQLIYTNGVSFNQTNNWAKVKDYIWFTNFYTSLDDVAVREIATPELRAEYRLEIGTDLLAIDYDRGILFKKVGAKVNPIGKP